MYDPEKPYADAAKREQQIDDIAEGLYNDMWYSATEDEGADKVERNADSEVWMDIIKNIAITREAVLKAPPENRQAIKAMGYDSIYKALDGAIWESAQEEAVDVDPTEREYDPN